MTFLPWIPIPHLDPVCGRTVDEKTARLKTGYAGRTYYFCSPDCMKRFTRNPTKYAK